MLRVLGQLIRGEDAMQYRQLGKSGLLVSPICLGTMTFGTPVDEAKSIRLVHESMDSGINFIDTANAYEGYNRVLGSAGGVAERILGKALVDRRDRAIVATKVGAPLGPGDQDRGLSSSHVHREVEKSLVNLQSDYIDLYIIHWPDKHTPLETTLAVLDQLVRQGKVRYVGASNHSAAQLCKMLWIADVRNHLPIVSSQIPLSLLQRAFEPDLQFCEAHGITVTPYQSLQGGLLTGKYRRHQEPPADSRAVEKPGWIWPRDDALFDKLEGIETLIGAAGAANMTQYALAWTLRQAAVTSVIIGAKGREQVVDALGALEVQIPEDHFEMIDQICPPPWKQNDPIRS